MSSAVASQISDQKPKSVKSNRSSLSLSPNQKSRKRRTSWIKGKPKPVDTPAVEVVKSLWDVQMPLVQSYRLVEESPGWFHSEENSSRISSSNSSLPQKSTMEPCVSSTCADIEASIAEDDQPIIHPIRYQSLLKRRSKSLTEALKAEVPDNTSAIFSSGSISPLGDFDDGELWATFDAIQSEPDSDPRKSVVSPLPINIPNSRLSGLIPDLGTRSNSDISRGSPYSNSTETSSNTTTSSPNLPSTTFYSPSSSTSSLCEDTKVDVADTEDDISYNSIYGILNPVDAGVFDDEEVAFEFNQQTTEASKKPLSLNESKLKPLPPRPGQEEDTEIESPVLPLEFRRKRYSASLTDPSLSFNPNPLSTNQSALDAVLRRSGQNVKESRDLAQSVSLRKATEDLEAHLLGIPMSATQRLAYSPSPPLPPKNHPLHPNAASYYNQMNRSSEYLNRPHSSLRQDISQRRNHQSQTQGHVSDVNSKQDLRNTLLDNVTLKPRFTSSGRKPLTKRSVSPILEIATPEEEDKKLEVEEEVGLEEEEIEDKKPTKSTINERFTRSMTFSRGKKGAERNLRLRLPPLRTNDLSKKASAKKLDLSVLESPPKVDDTQEQVSEDNRSQKTVVVTPEKSVADPSESFDDFDDIADDRSEKTAIVMPEQSVAAPSESLHDVDDSCRASLYSVTAPSMSIYDFDDDSNESLYSVAARSMSVYSVDHISKALFENESEPEVCNIVCCLSGGDASNIPTLVAEHIILRIIESVEDFNDLFSLAELNTAFYRTYKRHEFSLIKDTLFRMSPVAWELREVSPPWEDDNFGVGVVDQPVPDYTPNLYIRHYTRDLNTMAALKSLILVRCESFLRPETVQALAGLDEKRSPEIDDAFWRVWTFCKIFGCGKDREEDIEAQADWLNGGAIAESVSQECTSISLVSLPVGSSVLLDPPHGFAKGNGEGLSPEQLYDMMEIWTCLGVLLQVFHGKIEEAREYGVFDDSNAESGDVAHEEALLEGWTRYLLTLGPSAIFALIGLNPSAPTKEIFARAKSLGWTKWTDATKEDSGPGRWFLKEAVSRVYEQRHMGRSLSKSSCNLRLNSKSSSSTQVSRSPGSERDRGASPTPEETNAARQRQAGFAVELRKQRQETEDSGLGANLAFLCEERPISTFQEVMLHLDPSASKRTSCATLLPATTYRPPMPLQPALPKTSTPTPTSPAVSHSSSSASSLPSSSASSSASSAPSPALSDEKIICDDTPETPQISAEPPQLPPVHLEPSPQFIDPADKALHKLVKELGFDEKDAKWALKCTDTGESLDVEAAINFLLRQTADNASDTSLPEVVVTPQPEGVIFPASPEQTPMWRWA